MREGAIPSSDVSQGSGPRHPLVRVHPVTGKKALYLGRRPFSYICGYPVAESEALLDALWAHATDDQFIWHRTINRPGDILLWDNRCAMHYAVADLGDSMVRIMHRATAAGDRPV